MGDLSFQSKTFRDAFDKVDEAISNASNKQEAISLKNKVLSDLNINVEDYNFAAKQYFTALDDPSIDTEPTDSISRTLGRGAGQAIQGLSDLVSTASREILPTTIHSSIANLFEDVGEAIPSSMRRSLSATFDPYHGEGAIGGIEEIAGNIIPLLLGTHAVTRIGGAVLANSPKIVSQFNKLSKVKQKLLKSAGFGTGLATATTVLTDPRETTYDLLFSDPQAIEEAKKGDIELKDYAQAFLKNLAIELPFGALIDIGLPPLARVVGKYGRQGTRKVSEGFNASKSGQALKGVGRKAKQLFSSKRGTDANSIFSAIKSSQTPKAFAMVANAYVKELDNNLIKEFGDDVANNKNFREEIVNTYLQGKKGVTSALKENNPGLSADEIDRLATFRFDGAKSRLANTESIKTLDKMRGELDKLSQNLVDSGFVKGDLAGKILDNKEFYITRSYEIFDNPAFKKEMVKRLEKARTGGDAERKADVILNDAFNYVKGQMPKGTLDDEVYEVFDRLLKVEKGDDYGAIVDALSNMSKQYSSRTGTGGTTTAKTFKAKGDLPKVIRNLLGEVKDPSLNFAKTYEKLAFIQSEHQFLKEIGDIVNAKYIKKVDDKLLSSHNRTRNSLNLKDPDDIRRLKQAELDVRRELGDLGQVGKDALSRIVGTGGDYITKGDVTNPLKGLYASDEYISLIKNKLEPNSVFSFGDNALNSAYLKGKTLSQLVKTTYTPGTHVRNTIGNITMLAMQGVNPFGKQFSKAFVDVAKKLSNKGDVDFAKEMAELQTLGIIDTGIGIGTLRKNIESITKQPDGYITDKIKNTMVGKGTLKANEKLLDLYQAEDDLFKIIHYRNQLDVMKKAYGDSGLSESVIKRMAAERTREMMPNYNLVANAFKYMRTAPVGDFISFPLEMMRTTKNNIKYLFKDLASDNDVIKKNAYKKVAAGTAMALAPGMVSNLSRDYFGISADQEAKIKGLLSPFEAQQDKIYMSPLELDRNKRVGFDFVNLGPYDPYAYIRTFMKAFHAGAIQGDELSDYELDKIGVGILDNQLSPFVAPSMITDFLLDIAGKIRTGNLDAISELDFGKGARQLFLPTSAIEQWLQKRKQYEEFGETRYDKTIGEGEQDLGALFGFKTSRADLSTNLRFALNKELGKANKYKNDFNNLLKSEEATSILSTQTKPEQIREEYFNLNDKKIDTMLDIKDLINIAKSIGFTNYDIQHAITNNFKNKLTKEKQDLLFAAENNQFLPIIPKYSEAKREMYERGLIPFEDLTRYYNDYAGSELE